MKRPPALHETPPGRGNWQRLDGFPDDTYFQAVCAAMREAGVALRDSWRDQAWEWTGQVDAESYMDGPLAWAQHGLYVAWRVEDRCEPDTGEFGGLGWYWVPYSKDDLLGDFTKDLPVTALAEPDEVAAAVADLVRHGHGGVSSCG